MPGETYCPPGIHPQSLTVLPLQHGARTGLNPATLRIHKETIMNLSTPSFPIFLVSIILAILAALTVYARVKIPFISGHGFATLGISYLMLLAGNMFKGL